MRIHNNSRHLSGFHCFGNQTHGPWAFLSNHPQFDAGLGAWRSFAKVAVSEFPGDLFFLSFSALFCYNATEVF